MGRNPQKVRIASRRKWNHVVGTRINSKSPPGIDISKFNKIAEELHIYKQMVVSANHGFVIVNMKGNILYVNDCFARMHGYDAHWLLGKNMKIFHNTRQLRHVRAVFKQLRKSGKGLINEVLWRKRRDGAVFPTLTNNWILRDKSGHPVMLCATMVDISQIKQQEIQLEKGKKTLEAMLNATTDLVALMDKDLKYVDMNDNMAKGLRMPREKLIGKYSLALMEPEVAAIRKAKAKEAMATGKPVTFEHTSHGRNYSATCYPVTGTDGKITGIVIFAKDVTQQKKAEEEIKASKEQLETMLNATNDLVAMIDRQCNVVEVNKKMADAFGHTREELIGRCAWDFHTPEIAAQRRKKVEHVMATGKAMTFVDDDGNGRFYSNSCYPLKDLDGKVTGMVVFSKEVTEQKKVQEALEKGKKTLEAMLNASDDSIAMFDRDINFVEMNEHMADAFGQPREKLIGRCAWDCMPPKAMELRRPKAEQILATGKPVTYFDEDDQGRIYSTIGYPLKGPDGKVTGIVVFAKDVTQQIKAQVKLETSKKTLETMLNASGEAIAMVDRDLNLIEVNERMADSLGLPREKLIGRCGLDVMPPKVASARRAKMEQVIATGKPITFVDDGGRGRIFSNSGYPLKGLDGKVTGMVIFATDITQSKQAETELNYYREELFKLRRSAYLDLFSAMMGHQLSQPLTITNVLMEELVVELESGSFAKKKIIESLKACLRETNSAGETIKNMREHSRQWLEGRMERFSPYDVISDVVSSLELRARRAKIRIEFKKPKSSPKITGHRSAFEQVVLNITENAIEAADQKKWHRLVINTDKTDRQIKLQFRDDCSGIAKENLGKIFEPFYSTKTHRGGKSLGLGLPIINRILLTMGGEIRVKSAARKGTTFYVDWPLK